MPHDLHLTVGYLAWNKALAEAVYPTLPEAAPVYLNLDEGQRLTVAHSLGFDSKEFEDELARCIKGVLDFQANGPTSMFRTVNEELWRWRRLERATREAPPVLPLLSLLTVAAAHMTAGDGMAETNFYGRVLAILKVEDSRNHFEQGYRRFGERYWATLERWLEENDGLRGLPTAVAIGHRFVGLPISQVLVREGDRAKFTSYFLHAGFPPGSMIPPAELEQGLDSWIKTEPCPVSQALAHHWRSPGTRSRILDVASSVLASWDGRIQTHLVGTAARRAALALNVGTFPRKRIEFSPIAYLPDAGTARSGQIKTSDGWQELELTPFAPGIIRIGQPQALDNKSLLEGLLEVRDSFSDQEVRRAPRRVMVFRKSELAGAFLEAEQVMLGEEVFIVTRNEPRLMAKIHHILTACARPGWQALADGFDGVPDGWTIVRGVQIVRSPSELIPQQQLDLRALVPLVNNQLIVAGGFSLPGSVRGKWHRAALPEARAISDDPDGFEVRLLDYGDGEADERGEDDTPLVLQTWGSEGPGVIIADLAELDLADGYYRVELRPHGSATSVTSITIRVRSGDQVDEKQREKVEAADQFLDDPLSVLSASAVTGNRVVAGALVEGNPERPEPFSCAVAGAPQWALARSARAKATFGIETLPPDSCLYTGAHHTHVETVPHDAKGQPLEPFVIGTCRRCGLTRRFPSSARRARKRMVRRRSEGQSESTAPIPVSAIHQLPDAPAWDNVLDAVFHCGAGTMQTFERIAMFAEPSALMVDHLARVLFALGHIDLLRHPESLALESWDTAPSALVPTPHGWFLAGYWPQRLVRAQHRLAPGLRLRRASNAEAPTSYFFASLPEPLARGVELAPASIELALQLPHLSEVIDALPRTGALPRAQGLTAFDPVSAKWQDAEGMGHLGGYRIRRFTTDDVLRTPTDLAQGTMAVSTVHLSKHATALLWGRKPLLAYDAESQTLSVPLGANLPGLYERAVVLASGLAPQPNRGALEYRYVPPALASHVAYLLSH